MVIEKEMILVFCLFDDKKTASIYVENLSEPIMLAVADLRRNLLELSGKSEGFEVCEDGNIRILTVDGAPESYKVEVFDGGVIVTGGDVLGTVFGIYAFATKVLGISPTYRLTDLFPSQRDSMMLEPAIYSSENRNIKFRGWFLNDEDLLTDFKDSGGVRHIDYYWYHNTMHSDVLDMMIETALRLEINLMIPSSFVDIDNPDEEKLVEAVYRRGMYISQHHVEPLGVSYFGASGYMKRHGIEGAVSFITNRQVMEEIWRYYAQKWAKYSDKVIWQFGLRGRADEAVWKRDKNVPLDDEGRGVLISDAINTQYNIVRETLGSKEFFSTATLWLEGARLYGGGFLRLPDSTMAIFSDVGLDQMFGDDFYSVKRLDGRQYGVYYHVAFYGRGPHLADTCNPLKMDFSYKEALRKNSLAYSIVNVSNVRPLHYSICANAELMENVEDFDYESFADKFHKFHFGKAADTVKKLRERFYLSCADLGEVVLKNLCDGDGFYYHDYGKLPFVRYTADDGDLYMTGKRILRGEGKPYECYDALKTSVSKLEGLLEDMRRAEGDLPDESLGYYRCFLLWQTEYMLLSTKWCMACCEMDDMDKNDRAKKGKEAVSYLEEILEARKVEAQEKWEGWHKGDTKLDIAKSLDMTKKFAGLL